MISDVRYVVMSRDGERNVHVSKQGAKRIRVVSCEPLSRIPWSVLGEVPEVVVGDHNRFVCRFLSQRLTQSLASQV